MLAGSLHLVTNAKTQHQTVMLRKLRVGVHCLYFISLGFAAILEVFGRYNAPQAKRSNLRNMI